MTLMYKEFIIKGTPEEIEELIELIQTKSNTVNINLDTYDKCSRVEEYLEKYPQNLMKNASFCKISSQSE